MMSFPPNDTLRDGRVRPHTCRRCQHVFPGEPDEILVGLKSSWSAPLDQYNWKSYSVNRLQIALVDLKAWKEEGCELARFVCEQAEREGNYKDEVSNAVQFFTNTSRHFWLLEGYVHLGSLRKMEGLPNGIDGQKCYVPEIRFSCYVTVEDSMHPRGDPLPIINR
jgi:hypothetical protein